MKKSILILLVIMLSVGMLAGCEDSSAPENSSTAPAAADKPAADPAPAADSQEPTAADKFADLKLVKELEQKNIKLVEVFIVISKVYNWKFVPINLTKTIIRGD